MAWLLITFPVFWLGVGTRYPFAWFGPYEQSLGVLFWATVTTLWIAGFVRQWGKRLPQQTLHRIYAVYVGLSLVLVPILDLVQAAHFKAHGYQFPSWLLILSGLQGLVAWIVFKSCKPGWIFAWSVSVAVLHQWVAIAVFPIAPTRSDMLATITMTAQQFLQGDLAYTAKLEGWRYGIGYLPGMWLSYLPSAWLDFDPRILNGFWLIGIGAVLWRTVLRMHIQWLPFAVLWFINPYLLFRHELYLSFFWLLGLMTTSAVFSRRRGLAVIGIALCCVTMTWAWILAPFWLMLTSRHWKHLAVNTICVMAVVCAVFGAFYIREGDVFLRGITIHFRMVVDNTIRRELCLGYSAMASFLGVHGWMSVLQKVALLGCGVWGLVRWAGGRPVAVLGMATFWGFCLTIDHQENYQYLFPLLLLPVWYGQNDRTRTRSIR